MKARHFFSRRELSALVSVLVLVATGCSDAIFSPKNQTISFAQIPSQTLGVAPLSLTATASSSLPVSFASTTQTVCTVSSNTTSGFSVALIATGTCSIVATQAGGSAPVAGTNGNVTYEAAAPVSQSFTVNGEGQTITFNQIAAQTIGTPLTLTATASSGLAVSFASTSSSVCTISGTTATFVAAGICTIDATQAGNGTYAAATMVPQSFTVNPAPGGISTPPTAQSITFTDSIPTAVVYSAGLSYPISATGGGSGNPVTFSVSGPATLSGGALSITGTGTVTITANQAGNATYAAAPAVMQSIVVSTTIAQAITFTDSLPTTAVYSAGLSYPISATGGGSGNPVTFNVSGPATLSGGTLLITGTGTVTVTANQAGNATYAVAPAAMQSIVLSATPNPVPTITAIMPAALRMAIPHRPLR